MATLQESLALVDEVAKELTFYDVGGYKQVQEQTAINRSKDLLEKVKAGIMAHDPDGYRADKLTAKDWRKFADLVAPLAKCFTTASSPTFAPTAKTRHASATAVAVLAVLSSCNPKAKVILTSAVEAGVVDAFVSTLRHSLRNPVADRVVRAMLYKLIDALMGLTLYASTQQQQALVARDVVDVCLELVTSGSVEPESKLLASKTLYNCLVTPGRVVTALRTSKVTALNGQLQQLASQVPDPVAAASLAIAGSASAPRAISMPVMLPAILSWIWFLPDYILDHLAASLTVLLNRVVVLVWPEGCPGIPIMGPTREEPAAGPVLAAQQSLPNRSLRQTFQNLFAAISTGMADSRLVRVLRGARLPELGALETEPGYNTALPVRLVQVVKEGRSDGVEVKVALELLDELFACDASGHPELADDALSAGLLRSMTNLAVFAAMRTEMGLSGLSAYVRLAVKLVKRAPFTLGLASRLRESGVSASVAYMAFWPGGKLSLKLEALQALHELVQLDANMADIVVAMPNFPIALTNTLLGGDPDTRRTAKKHSGGGSKKKGAYVAPSATAAAESLNQAARSIRDQMQEAAFDILTVVLDVARESDKVWQTVVESAMLPRLLQFCPAFPMMPSLLAEMLAAVGITFADHVGDVVSVGALQAACAPHVLQLLTHDEPVVAVAASRLLMAILEDMLRYRRDATDVEQGDEILKALVAAGAVIDTADAAASAARTAAAKATGAAKDGAGVEASPQKADAAGAAATTGQAAERSAAAGADAVDAGGPGAAAAAGERAGEPAAGLDKMDVDVAAKTAAEAPAAATTPAASTPAAGGGLTGGAGTTAPEAAIAGGSGNGNGAAEPEISEPVDVTAHGLGLLCAAMQSSVAAVLQRQRARTPASPVPAAGAAAAPSTSSPPSGGSSGSGHSKRDSGAADGAAAPASALALGPVTLHLQGPRFESLEALLTCCAILSETSLQMPPHGALRKHLARAFAYAKPVAEELSAALRAYPAARDVAQSHQALIAGSQRLLVALKHVPVLDVALLPKPKVDEEEDAREGAAAAANGGSRKGRPPGSSNKRSSQNNLVGDQAQPLSHQPSKRQRTAAAAAAATATAAAAAAAAAGLEGDGSATARSRASALVAEGRNGDTVATGSPRTSGLRSGSVAAAAAAAAAARSSVDRDGGAAGGQPSGSGPGRGADVMITQGKARAPGKASVAAAAAVLAAAAAAEAAAVAAGLRADAVVAIDGGGGAAVLQAARTAAGRGGGLPLPAMPRPVKAPPPTSAMTSSLPAALAESPLSLDNRSSAAASGSATAATAVAAATGGASVIGGRPSVADFKARFLDMKNQNAKLGLDLEAQKRAAVEAESLQKRTAGLLASRTQEVQKLLQELADKDDELGAMREALQAAKAEAAKAVVEEGGRAAVVEQLRIENARLQQELDQLNDVELE